VRQAIPGRLWSVRLLRHSVKEDSTPAHCACTVARRQPTFDTSAASGATRFSISPSPNEKAAKFTPSLKGMKRSHTRLLSLLNLHGSNTVSILRQNTTGGTKVDLNATLRAPRTRPDQAMPEAAARGSADVMCEYRSKSCEAETYTARNTERHGCSGGLGRAQQVVHPLLGHHTPIPSRQHTSMRFYCRTVSVICSHIAQRPHFVNTSCHCEH
jgi:hypothetical protein